MANEVKFKINGLTSALTNEYVRVTDAPAVDVGRSLIYEGYTLTTDDIGNAIVNVGSNGSDGQDVLIYGDNFNSAGIANYKGFRCAGVLETITVDTVQGFDVDKIVMLGDSIANQVFAPQSTRNFVQSYASSKYGKTITVVQDATPSDRVSDVKDQIDATIANFASEPNTHFMIQVGTNDVVYGTEFLDLEESVRTQKINDLRYIYDAVHTAGKKLIQSSITFSNVSNGSERILDDVPYPKTNELYGSYTYVRDWIVPVMQEKAPEYLRDNNWPMVDAYNFTRNMVDDWKNITDVTHPNIYARGLYALELTDGFIKLSLGEIPAEVTPSDYSVTTLSGSEIDVVYGLGAEEVTRTATSGINWFTRSKWDTGAAEAVNINNSIANDGSTTNLSLYTHIARAYDGGAGNSVDANNETASLLNNSMLLSYVRTEQSGESVLYAMVDGLDPFKNYNLSVTASSGSAGDSLGNMFIASGVSESINAKSPTPESSNLISNTAMSDYAGRLFIAVEEDNTSNINSLSGVRVYSAG